MAELPYFLPTTLPGDTTVIPAPEPTETGGADGTITPITSFCDSGLALLLKQYADSPLLQALICLMLDRVQEVDDASAQIPALVLDVNLAEGAHLDLLGRIVGETRNGESDAIYRRGILARVLINRSQGRIGDLISIVRVYAGLGDTDTVDIQDVQPARVEVRVNGALIVEAKNLLVRLRRAKAAGVALQLITAPPGVPTSRLFRLGRAADYPEGNTLTGLGWTADPDHGGYLSHALA